MSYGSSECICFDLVIARGLVNWRKLRIISVAFFIRIARAVVGLALNFLRIILVLYGQFGGTRYFYYRLVCFYSLVSSLNIGFKGHLFAFYHIWGPSWTVIPCNVFFLMYPFSRDIHGCWCLSWLSILNFSHPRLTCLIFCLEFLSFDVLKNDCMLQLCCSLFFRCHLFLL